MNGRALAVLIAACTLLAAGNALLTLPTRQPGGEGAVKIVFESPAPPAPSIVAEPLFPGLPAR